MTDAGTPPSWTQWGDDQEGTIVSRPIGIGQVGEDVSARLARLEVRMQHVVTHEQIMWAVLAVLAAPPFAMLVGSLVG